MRRRSAMARRRVASTPIQMEKVLYNVTKLGGGITQNGVAYPGGLDLTTPSLVLQPGACRDMLNFECAQSGGYSRIVGYERFDGRAAPSDATYQIIQVDAFTNAPSVGQVIAQASSGASGTITEVVTGTTPYVAATMTTGSFDGSGQLKVGTTVIGNQVATTVQVTSLQDAMYLNDAASAYRANIGAVPGSGPILDVIAMNIVGVDEVFAFRANAGNTAVNIYKASSGGWVLVPLFDIVSFTAGSQAGNTPPADGETLTQGGVTATIKRVMWQSGTFNGNSAAGRFIITTPAGGNFAAGAATTTSGVSVTLSGAQSAITITPGGKYEHVKYNFGGSSSTRRAYGCDGINKAFEFDGTVYAPITTGASPDQPTHVTGHRDILFLSVGSSLIFCGPGTPYKFLATDGGGEIAVGDIITSMLTMPGSQTSPTLGVYTKTNTSFLYGTDQTTFSLVTFNTGLGALPYSTQNLFDTFFFDPLGVVTLRTTLNWGNFLPSSLTKNILPFVLQERDKLTASTIYRSKSQYRVFFSDGYSMWVTVTNGQYLGVGIIQFPNPVSCVDQQIDGDNNEVIYFGSSDGNGFVYQMEKGTSFDGASISAHVTMAWDPIKSPRILKRFRAASIEIQGTAYAAINFGYLLGYNSPNIGQPSADNSFASQFRPAPYWDSFTWDNFYWDGQTLSPTDVDMTGTAENVQFIIGSNAAYIASFTVNSVITHHSLRRGMRV